MTIFMPILWMAIAWEKYYLLMKCHQREWGSKENFEKSRKGVGSWWGKESFCQWKGESEEGESFLSDWIKLECQRALVEQLLKRCFHTNGEGRQEEGYTNGEGNNAQCILILDARAIFA